MCVCAGDGETWECEVGTKMQKGLSILQQHERKHQASQ